MNQTLNLVFSEMNILAIVTAVVANQIIGAFWYSPLLFGKIWAKEVGIDMEKIDKKDANRSMLYAFLVSIPVTIILAVLVIKTDMNAWLTGAILGAMLGVFFALILGTIYLFENKSFKQFLINGFYPIVSFIVQGIILTVW